MKLLHCADFHLDTPFQGADGAARRAGLRDAFSAVIRLAKTERVDLLLLAGDLFDRMETTARSTVAFVAAEFASIPDCPVVICPGNHDPMTPGGSVWQYAEFPANVHIFRTPELSCFSFPESGVDVYGYAFDAPTLAHAPFAGFTVPETGRIPILCAHGDLYSPLSVDCPFSKHDLEASGFRYAALGHIHDRSEVCQAENTFYAYAGCPCGRDFGERGVKGVYLVEVTREKVSAEFVPIAPERYEWESIPADGMRDGAAVADAVAGRIKERGYGAATRLRIILTGNTAPGFAPSEAALRARFPQLAELQLDNQTLPLYDTDALERDPGIRGAFFRTLRPKLETGTREERETAALALKMGLRALAGEEPEDAV